MSTRNLYFPRSSARGGKLFNSLSSLANVYNMPMMTFRYPHSHITIKLQSTTQLINRDELSTSICLFQPPYKQALHLDTMKEISIILALLQLILYGVSLNLVFAIRQRADRTFNSSKLVLWNFICDRNRRKHENHTTSLFTTSRVGWW